MMGCAWMHLEFLREAGAFQDGGIEVLDIGCQNVYSAPPSAVGRFVESFNPAVTDVAGFADDIGRRSAYGGIPINGGAYLGEVLEQAGMHYRSLDIFRGYNVELFDLNFDSLPADYHGRFDLVLNFGTTEHVLNQFNAFKVIHEATKHGGYVFHQLPISGHFGHGLFCYDVRFFPELAAACGFEIVACRVEGPRELRDKVEKHDHFQHFLRNVAITGPDYRSDDVVPNGAISVLMRRVQKLDFRAPLESSTSAGAIPWTVETRYVSLSGEMLNRAEYFALRRQLDELGEVVGALRPLVPLLLRLRRIARPIVRAFGYRRAH
jgi:hypothetical protein